MICVGGETGGAEVLVEEVSDTKRNELLMTVAIRVSEKSVLTNLTKVRIEDVGDAVGDDDSKARP